jgi:pyruvate/2-oxoglutarate/acetoin dehydrogenase E1 component
MFGDFVTLVADQLINHAAKFQWMYNDQVRVPLVVRTPMGGRRGYGPTHSQSLEKIFLGVPGLRVVAPNTLSDPADMLQAAILEDDQPVLFVEHKLLYTCALLEAGQGELRDFHMETHGGQYPAHTLRFAGGPPASLTIATYGYHFELARAAALKLAYDYEIFAEILVYSQLSPYQPALLLDSVGRTGRLLTIEEGTLTHGWGAEMGALVSAAGYRLKTARAAGLDLPIANAKSLEDEILPSLEKIVGMAIALVK